LLWIVGVFVDIAYFYWQTLLYEFGQDFRYVYYSSGDTRWRSWLRHWAASQEVAGSIRTGITENFH
jgi:hypothetical protein